MRYQLPGLRLSRYQHSSGTPVGPTGAERGGGAAQRMAPSDQLYDLYLWMQLRKAFDVSAHDDALLGATAPAIRAFPAPAATSGFGTHYGRVLRQVQHQSGNTLWLTRKPRLKSPIYKAVRSWDSAAELVCS